MAGSRKGTRRNKGVRLLAGASIIVLAAGAAMAQDGDVEIVQAEPAEPAPAAESGSVLQLDAISVLANRLEESAAESLGGVSVVTREEFERAQPSNISEIFETVPGTTTQRDNTDPGTAVNIRGLQDFGRVNVVIDGARQNFQRSGHAANGVFYIEPDLVGGVDIIRGPIANIYGSGAIGGVVAMRTVGVDDLLDPGERAGARLTNRYGTNGNEKVSTFQAGARVGEAFDIFAAGTFRDRDDYRDGNGDVVPFTGQEAQSGLFKLRARPMEGHELEVSGLLYRGEFVNRLEPGDDAVRRDSDIANDTYTAKYRFQSPDNPLIDLHASAYLNRVTLDQVDLDGARPGARRTFDIETTGIDVYNSSLFAIGPVATTLTYGFDYFRDAVDTEDLLGTGELFTPSGERSVLGTFAQAKFEYDTWLEVIGALRYDAYELKGQGVDNDGSRLSPKVTVGVTPVEGIQFYGSYAEGYRAPAITETLVAGLHPPPAAFELLPNPDLDPEIGRTIEAGVNLRYDDILMPGDAFRAKAGIFRNDIRDFIGQQTIDRPDVANPCLFGQTIFGNFICFAELPFDALQYVNISQARIEGVEMEGMYDWGWGFAGLSGHILRGKDRDTGDPLVTIPPDRLVTTLGFRAFDRRVTFGARHFAVAAQERTTPGLETPSYDLVNLFAGWEPNDNVSLAISLENIFDRQYTQYLDSLPSPGFGAKFALSIKLGVE